MTIATSSGFPIFGNLYFVFCDIVFRFTFRFECSPDHATRWILVSSKNIKWPHWLGLKNWIYHFQNHATWTEKQSEDELFLRPHLHLKNGTTANKEHTERDDQNAEGRDGADVAQIRVAAAHAAVLRCIATFVVKIAQFVVRAVTTDYSLDVDFELNFDALIEPDAASLFLPFAETTVVTIVAFERQNWKTRSKINYLITML